jgi:SAM-dependent methyltransferase
LLTGKELRRRLARAIIIDRAPTNSTSFIGRVARERSEENYRFASNFVAGKTILDVGGGAGIGHNLLIARGATSILSLDQHIASTAEDGDPRVQSVKGDFLTHPLPDESFEVIICLGTLFYLGDSHGALRKMRRLLTPGGMLIINCINQDMVRRYFGMPLEDIDEKFSTAYDESGFQALIRRHFEAEPELFVQQPVPDPRNLPRSIAFWLLPLTWPLRRHPVMRKAPSMKGMYNYAIVNKNN